MDKIELKKAKKYDITYLQSYSSYKSCRYKSKKIEVTLKRVMFYKSTEHYYVFFAPAEYIRIKKENLISAEEI